MKNIHFVFVACICLLFGTSMSCAHAQNPTDDSIAKLRRLEDSQFIGGLNFEESALGESIAAEIKSELPGAETPCNAPDPMQGALVSTGIDSTGEQTVKLPNALQEISDTALHGAPVQRAVALYAIGLIGPTARTLARPLEHGSSERDSWVMQALEGVTCQEWSGGVFSTTPSGALPAPDAQYMHGVEREKWLVKQARNSARRWPKGFFKAAWSETHDPRPESTRVPIELGADTLNDIAQMVMDDRRDTDLRAQFLDIATTLEHEIAPIAEASKALLKNPDEVLARRAESLVIAAGIPESVDVFRRWLLVDHMPYWAWEHRIVGLAKYSDQIIPVLVAELADPVFTNRVAAAKALGDLHTEQAIAPLMNAISSFDWLTSQAAVAALAQFSSSHPEVKTKLINVEANYWSGRVRAVAERALQTGEGMQGNPFGCESAISKASREHAAAGKKLECIEMSFGGGVIEHDLPSCLAKKTAHARYRSQENDVLRVFWKPKNQKTLPRGIKPKDISNWCGSKYSSFSILTTAQGWLVGCIGFEGEGMLSFVPRIGPATPQPLLHMGVAALAEVDGHIFAAGLAPFAFDDAGALYELNYSVQGQWGVKPVAALPSVPDAVVSIGHSLIFRDALNVVQFDPHEGISRMTCDE